MVAERTSPLQSLQLAVGGAVLMSVLILVRDMEFWRLASLMLLIIAGLAGHYRRYLTFKNAR